MKNIKCEPIIITNYCHKACEPLKNIMNQSKEEAFLLAERLAKENPEETSFGRFADFANYYEVRNASDTALRQKFISAGGNPELEHPLSFVLGECEYLKQWFSDGSVFQMDIEEIPTDKISFTYGDSVASHQRTGSQEMFLKEQLYEMIALHGGSVNSFLEATKKRCHYIEVQIWTPVTSDMREQKKSGKSDGKAV